MDRELHLTFAPDPGDACRVLGAFRPVLTHDLTNRLVALKGLARLLATDYADRLDADGHSVVQSLDATAGRMAAQVAQLADLCGLVLGGGEAGGRVSLAEAVHRAAAAAGLLPPAVPVTYQVTDDGPPLPVSPRPLQLLLAALFRATDARRRPSQEVRVEVAARPGPGGVELLVADDAGPCGPAAWERLRAGLAGGPGGPPDEALDWQAVRLVLAGGRAAVGVRAGAAGTRVTIAFPPGNPGP